MKRAGIIFFISVIIFAIFIKVISLLGPVDINSNTKKVIYIAPGKTSREIGEKLYNNNLISSPTLFNFLVSITGFDEKLQAGYYEFNTSSSLLEHIRDLVAGRVATFKLTVPEGYTVEEIAARLSQKIIYSKSDFLRVARKGKFNKPFLPDPGLKYKYSLEGFLYPDTYIIPRGYSPEQIFMVMLDQFEKEWWSDLKKSTDKNQYSPYEIVTIASIIEMEARLDKEKPLIGAVIYNRLKKNMLLQVDASIQYSLDSRKERIMYKDLKIDSPYNTYLYYGLPPGPICNPGSEAIKAALKPADVDYLFYFALDNGSHVFSDSYQEHLRLQAKSKKEGLINE